MSHPLAPALERAMLVGTERIAAAARAVVAGRPPVVNHWRAVGQTAAGAPPRALPDTAAPAEPQGSIAEAPSPGAAPRPGEPITMPFGDLTVSEGKIVRWAKAEGQAVRKGELVAEIETDKAVVEIEAPIDGVLGPIEQGTGTVVPMGGRIGAVLSAKA